MLLLYYKRNMANKLTAIIDVSAMRGYNTKGTKLSIKYSVVKHKMKNVSPGV